MPITFNFNGEALTPSQCKDTFTYGAFNNKEVCVTFHNNKAAKNTKIYSFNSTTVVVMQVRGMSEEIKQTLLSIPACKENHFVKLTIETPTGDFVADAIVQVCELKREQGELEYSLYFLDDIAFFWKAKETPNPTWIEC